MHNLIISASNITRTHTTTKIDIYFRHCDRVMIRGIRVIKRIRPGVSRDCRYRHVAPNMSMALPLNFSNFLHTGGKRSKAVELPTLTTVEDFNHVVNKLVQKTSGGKNAIKTKTKTKKARRGDVSTMSEILNNQESTVQNKSFQDSFISDSNPSVVDSSSRPADSALPTALQQLLNTAPLTSSQQLASSDLIDIDSASPSKLRDHVEHFCITQPPDILLSCLLQLIASQAYQGAQITLHYLIERAHTEKDLFEILQQACIEICGGKQLPLFRYLMKQNSLVDTRKNILPFFLSTAVKLGKEQGHATSVEDLVSTNKNEGGDKNKIRKLGHMKLSSQLKGFFYDRPNDLLHLLETSPDLTHLVSAYVMIFSTSLLSSSYVEKQHHLWEKIYLHLSHNEPLEWYISHERLLRGLSANFWGNVISRGKAPTIKQLRTKIRKLPPSQAIWIEATLMTNELAHANALVEAMLNEGFSATEEIGQHLVRLFTRDMDPADALDVIDDLHKQYGSYISLHTTFFSHWCRTRNSRAIMSMIKVLKARDQMTREFYIQAFQRLLKNGDFRGALYLAEIMARDTETSNHITAGEFLSAALYRGRLSIFPKKTTSDVSGLMTEGLRYHLHVERFANYISKFNETREEPTTRLPVHVTLRYLNELHKRGLYASMAWYQYNLEMMQICALTQPEVEVFLRGLARLFSRDRYISLDFDKEFADIVQQSEAIVERINDRISKTGKGLVEEEESAFASEMEPLSASEPLIKEPNSGFSNDSGVLESSDFPSANPVQPPSYNQVFSSPYFQFETIKWGAIKSPKDPGSGVRILNMLRKNSKSYIRSYVVADAIQHVATKLYISTPPSYHRLRSQTSFNMVEFLQQCEREWNKPLKWKK
ncbi:YALI0E09020p [Yarrowia lipolytica CLIB122]|uniref:YALI0E09020p n=2 Tax=Yarrowia lipolytica TaxID=4952 RepID=Q6C6J5_YARLI|nr:YALI0E09020p [Yarrowia lipolytica CLIB122]CAG79306.1 YALI0E09020p [Yarrowia lipolytica CLIB122]|eukprot:XP_503717.1 YALI0E09020p [Yarrowia lipolytica CLIB122]